MEFEQTRKHLAKLSINETYRCSFGISLVLAVIAPFSSRIVRGLF